jgi:plastocyanin
MSGTRFVLGVSLAVAAFALASLALVGCGGGDDEGSGADTTDTTATDTTETSAEASATLVGTVGPDFTITLTTEDGASVTSLPAGSYTVEVEDLSSAHNFHLSGPGVDTATDVGAEETVTWEVELEAGTYTFVCDPHANTMNGSFDVTG